MLKRPLGTAVTFVLAESAVLQRASVAEPSKWALAIRIGKRPVSIPGRTD